MPRFARSAKRRASKRSCPENRNWTHIGHEKVGPRVAAILRLTATDGRPICQKCNQPGAAEKGEHLAADLVDRGAPLFLR
jgi:hypothetical protein